MEPFESVLGLEAGRGIPVGVCCPRKGRHWHPGRGGTEELGPMSPAPDLDTSGGTQAGGTSPPSTRKTSTRGHFLPDLMRLSTAISAGVGRRPTVIQTPSGSRTLAIQPSVVLGSYPVGLPPCFNNRR